MPPILIDSSSDLRLVPLFIEILVHRRHIYSTHIEVESQPSIYAEVVPMLLPIFASLFKWAGEESNQTITFYYRAGGQLAPVNHTLSGLENRQIEFNQIHEMPPLERMNIVCDLLSVTNDRIEIHSDYHLWLLIIRRWHRKRELPSVYLYAIILSFIRSVFVTDYNSSDNDDNLPQTDEPKLSISLNINQFQRSLEDKTRESIGDKMNRMLQFSRRQKKFHVNVIHEFNCLQTTLMIGWQINQFFEKPFSTRIQPQHFLCGSFFYAFVGRYTKESELNNPMKALLSQDPILIGFFESLLNCLKRLSILFVF